MNEITKDNLTGLLTIAVIIFAGILYVMNDKVDVWHPSDIYPNCDDQRNIIDVRIKNIDDENCKEVLGYFDVSKQCYYSYTDGLVTYRFSWCYE